MSAGAVGGRQAADGRLERRYRRLLAWYPAEHRTRYGDEMLGVLMDGARPQQRFPGARETAGLLRAAVGRRLAPGRTGLTDSRWADAVAVFGALALVLALGTYARKITGPLPYQMSSADWWPYSWSWWPEWLPLVVWAVVALGAFVDWRIGAGAAWTAVLWTGVVGAGVLADGAPDTQMVLRSILLAVITAAALTVPGGVRRGAALLGRRGMTAAILAGALTAASAAIPALMSQLAPAAFGVVPDLLLLPYVIVPVLLVLAVVGTAPPVRHRLIAVMAPIATLVGGLQLMVGHELQMFAFASSGPVGWALVLVATVLALAAALLPLHRERQTRT